MKKSMFTKKIHVLHISKALITLHEVRSNSTAEIKKVYESEWSEKTLQAICDQLIADFDLKKVRLLFSGDCAYVIKYTLAKDIPRDAERAQLFTQMTSLIPETFTDDEWDFKELKTKDSKKKTYLIFVPVMSCYKSISAALSKAHIQVEAIESTQLAQIRHKNPVMGIALKEDLQGKDDEVLNLKLSHNFTETTNGTISKLSTQSEDEPVQIKSEQLLSKKYLLALLLTVLAALILIPSLLYLQKNKHTANNFNRSLTDKIQPTETPNPTQLPPTDLLAAVTASATVQINFGEYSVSVLNASGTPKAASTVATLLKENGFSTVTVGNSTVSGQVRTNIQVKESSVSAQLSERLSVILDVYNVQIDNSYLPNDFKYDVLIKVGKRE